MLGCDGRQFISEFRKLAQYVQDSEPETLAYHVYNDSSNPNAIHLYERSATASASPHTHTRLSRPPHSLSRSRLLSTLALTVYSPVCPRVCVAYCSYVNEHAWHEVHEKSKPFTTLFEPSRLKRMLKHVQVVSMTEAGYGFLSR